MVIQISKTYIQLAKLSLCGMIVLLSTACNTVLLHRYIEKNEPNFEEYYSDKVIGIAFSKNKQQQEVTFIGGKANYLLNKGDDEVLNIFKLKSAGLPEIKVDRVVLYNTDDYSTTEFHAKIRFVTKDPVIDKEKGSVFVANGFKCYKIGESTGHCLADVKNLQGVIKKKAKIEGETEVLFFDKSFNFSFEKSHDVSAARLLYPGAVVVDILTAPFQMLAVMIKTWE